MRILLLTGLKEELVGLLASGFEWDSGTRFYRSLVIPELFAGTTGPGLRKKKELRKAIQKVAPDVVINGGLVGALRQDESLHTGDRMLLGEVIDAKSRIVYPGGRGRERLVSVDHPVFQPIEKMDLRLDHHADACDMEAAPLLDLLGRLRADALVPELLVIFCKVVGDLPEDYFLFQREREFRGWDRKNTREKLEVFLKDPGDTMRLFRLFQLKKKALDSLTGKMGGLVRFLVREGRVPEELESVFVPH